MKKIVLSLIMILLIVSMSCTVFATSGNADLDKFLEDMRQEENAGEIEDDEKTEQIPEGTLKPEDQETDEKTETEKLPETTPHAGLEDYTGLVFVGIFAVSAIYAYKKIKEYNA